MVRKRNVSQKRKLERKAYRRRNSRLSVSALSDNASETSYDKEVSCDLINSARNIRDLMEMMVSKIRRLELEHKRKAYLCKKKYRKKAYRKQTHQKNCRSETMVSKEVSVKRWISV